MQNALIHIYTGDGKGKTTALVGLCFRCSGRGFKVGMTSFLKDFDSGEYLQPTPYTVFKGTPVKKFWFMMTDEEKAAVKKEHTERLFEIFRIAKEENYDLIALDEVLGSIAVGALNEQDVIKCLKETPDTLEVAISGRDPSAAMVELADYVSEIKAVKHPFEKGIGARVGIEK